MLYAFVNHVDISAKTEDMPDEDKIPSPVQSIISLIELIHNS